VIAVERATRETTAASRGRVRIRSPTARTVGAMLDCTLTGHPVAPFQRTTVEVRDDTVAIVVTRDVRSRKTYHADGPTSG
jgi:hypothetical protein